MMRGQGQAQVWQSNVLHSERRGSRGSLSGDAPDAASDEREATGALLGLAPTALLLAACWFGRWHGKGWRRGHRAHGRTGAGTGVPTGSAPEARPMTQPGDVPGSKRLHARPCTHTPTAHTSALAAHGVPPSACARCTAHQGPTPASPGPYEHRPGTIHERETQRERQRSQTDSGAAQSQAMSL